ncbi:hypothetical protein [Rosenbergiella australiborealis]|uniref:hypothetical protein n=1 Tax=Rosenbergiella australiborealis TaxID=1544696 RepID=UPI001F4E7DAD|nr:hypothetical protein [Rosenbergiella australiborealis]
MRKVPLTFIVLIALFAVGYGFYAATYKPHQAVEQQAYERFTHLPGYRLIKQQDPELWHDLSETFRRSFAEDASFQKAVGEVRGQLTALVNLRIVKADDTTVTNYIAVAVQQMQALNNISAESCFRFLYPQVSGGVNIGVLLSPEMNDADQQALEALFTHSLGHDYPRDVAAAHASLSQVVSELYPQWGNQLQQLNQSEDLATDHQKLCIMSIDLYRTILKLPKPAAANLIRQMVVG